MHMFIVKSENDCVVVSNRIEARNLKQQLEKMDQDKTVEIHEYAIFGKKDSPKINKSVMVSGLNTFSNHLLT